MSKTKGLLIINLGTPDNPGYFAVFKYLRQFLMDPKVITVPFIFRFILVTLVIVPFRAFSSAKIYKKIWTDKGSPLTVLTNDLVLQLRERLPTFQVEFAMRYQQPSIEEKINQLCSLNLDEIIVLPLFPQYTQATTGSVFDEVARCLKKTRSTPAIRFISQFYDNPLFIEAWLNRMNQYDLGSYDHILFSYHGLPMKALNDIYEDDLCDDNNCEDGITDKNKFCYKATCYETTRLINQGINLAPDKFTVCFQSRLTKNWVAPFTDDVIKTLAKDGKKKLLVAAPAFTADNLETIYEIGDEYEELFQENGGEHLEMVPSLNSDNLWVDAILDIIR